MGVISLALGNAILNTPALDLTLFAFRPAPVVMFPIFHRAEFMGLSHDEQDEVRQARDDAQAGSDGLERVEVAAIVRRAEAQAIVDAWSRQTYTGATVEDRWEPGDEDDAHALAYRLTLDGENPKPPVAWPMDRLIAWFDGQQAAWSELAMSGLADLDDEGDCLPIEGGSIRDRDAWPAGCMS